MKKYLLYSILTLIIASASTHKVCASEIFSTSFYEKLKTCTPYSETRFSGDKGEIIGTDNNRCVVVKTVEGKKQVCAFSQSEVTNLVNAGLGLNTKKGWWNVGNNIFNKNPEVNSWNFYKYKCRDLK